MSDWVAYRVTAASIGPSEGRDWRADPWLDADERIASLVAAPASERLERTRGYREDYLAHSLERPFDRSTPVMEDVTAMMDAASMISGDCQLALFGRRVVWDRRLVTVEEKRRSDLAHAGALIVLPQVGRFRLVVAACKRLRIAPGVAGA